MTKPIEVSVKFQPNQQWQKRVPGQLTRAGIVHLTDAYWDTPDNDLAHQDTWLRERGERFTLRLPPGAGRRFAPETVYQEIDDEAAIRAVLSLSSGDSLAKTLWRADVMRFTNLVTRRMTYQLNGLSVVIDECWYENDPEAYIVGKLSTPVKNQKDIGGARERLTVLLRLWGLNDAPPRGKIVEYFRRHDPELFGQLWGK